MSLSRNRIFFSIFNFGLIINLLVFFDFQYFYLRSILTTLFLILIPGFLLMLAIKVKKLGFWEYLVYVISLSISFSMFSGAVIDLVLPLIKITKPLEVMPLLLSYDFFLLIILIIAYKRNDKIFLRVKLPRFDLLNKAFFILPLLFPIMSYAGAESLNNLGSSYLSTSLIFLIAIFMICLVLLRKRLNENIYPWAIFVISIALLFMYSQRGLHVSGWDIQSEYGVFMQTSDGLFWNLAQATQAYYAMLSITIFPTLVSILAKVSGEVIFKTIIQILFSFVPLTIYLLFKKFSDKAIAFVSVFYFISQGQFLEQMPTLARQEIAFIFFGASLLVFFNKNISWIKKNVLFLIFGCSLAVSHYSTAYVAVTVFVVSFCAISVLKSNLAKTIFSKISLNLKLKSKLKKRPGFGIGIFTLGLIILFNYLWTFQVTHSSDNIVSVVGNVYRNLSAGSGDLFRSVEANKAIWDVGVNFDYTLNDLRNYVKETADYYALKQQNTNLYSGSAVSQYSIQDIPPDSISQISSRSSIAFYVVLEFSKKIIKIFLLVGLLYFVILIVKSNYSTFPIEYLVMSIVFIFLSSLLILIPNISADYNFIRLYQQALMILALPTIIGGTILFRKIFDTHSIFIICIIVTVIFMNSSGFSTQILGGSNPLLQLNNFGTRYEKDLTHDGEIYGARWLSLNKSGDSYLYADEIASMRLETYGGFVHNNLRSDVIPQAMDEKAYVYLNYQNTLGREYRTYRGWDLRFNYPNKFLDENKDLIYSNGYSEIYK